MKRVCLAVLSLNSLLLAGCLYVSPIDEEPPLDDFPPYINSLSGVSPSMGVVNINLSLGGTQEFVISDYGDDNLDQTLYHRIIVDYRAAGMTYNPIFSVAYKSIAPHGRDRITYSYPACTDAITYPNIITDGKSIELYVLLADEEFLYPNPYYASQNFSQPFETKTGRNAVWVHWTLKFNGVCPEIKN